MASPDKVKTMNIIFRVIYSILKSVSTTTGLTYNEINIVVYYFFVPLILLFLVDRIIKKYIFSVAITLVWALLLLVVSNFSLFSDRVFDDSVVFLKAFSFVGWNYIVASVIVCVVAPMIIFAVLFYFAFPRLFRRRVQANTREQD